MGSRAPLRPGAEYKYQVGQIWEVTGPALIKSYLVRLLKFKSEIINGIEIWEIELVPTGDEVVVHKGAINTSWFGRGPFVTEMEVIAWAWAAEEPAGT